METGILWPPVAPATFEITTRLAAPADRVSGRKAVLLRRLAGVWPRLSALDHL
jgi:hypothetical protein